MDESTTQNLDFNLEIVVKELDSCAAEPGISLRHYIAAYKELDKIFYKLGKIFHFIAHDVEEKIGILESFLSDNESQQQYQTVETMLSYERSNQLLYQSNFVSGSRTLLRLHRALEFLVKFIDGIHRSQPDAKMSHLSKEVYDATLGQFHGWLVRKGAHLAFYVLPYRQDLIESLGGHLDPERANLVMEQTVVAGQLVYSTVQQMYADGSLLDLP